MGAAQVGTDRGGVLDQAPGTVVGEIGGRGGVLDRVGEYEIPTAGLGRGGGVTGIAHAAHHVRPAPGHDLGAIVGECEPLPAAALWIEGPTALGRGEDTTGGREGLHPVLPGEGLLHDDAAHGVARGADLGGGALEDPAREGIVRAHMGGAEGRVGRSRWCSPRRPRRCSRLVRGGGDELGGAAAGAATGRAAGRAAASAPARHERENSQRKRGQGKRILVDNSRWKAMKPLLWMEGTLFPG